MTPLPTLPARALDSHKGDYGRALLIGGYRGMTGAIGLAGLACLRGGAGLVTLAVPEKSWPTVAGYEPSYMTAPLVCTENGRLKPRQVRRQLKQFQQGATCVAIGPGLGRFPSHAKIARWLFETAEVPLVVDADALFALGEAPVELARHAGPRILTPHPGEFARLSGAPAANRETQIEAAKEIALKHGLVIVLKGHKTLITDGVRDALNQTGNPGMATGGSGDVLTGVITALVCQGLKPFDAAHLAAHLHGRAGDLAAAELGQVSLIASDLIRFLPLAFRELAIVPGSLDVNSASTT